MSYVAEPYAQFVDDLLTGLTGGVVRTRFVFLPENAPFDLAPPGPVLPGSLRLYGQANGAFARFLAGRDYRLEGGRRVIWLAEGGAPVADAVWPDEGSAFFANYEHGGPAGAAPLLTDRNPGSVVRLLSESFGREYAVISRQLEAVYRGAYLDTATGRDLDQLVRLVGLSRDRTTSATGVITFSRRTPAPADIFIPAGTRLSTAQPTAAAPASPPAPATRVVFETTEARTLRRGNLSVDAPIRALEAGAGGVAPARSVTVVHQPILGVDQASNAQPTRFGGADETDEALRARARRALDGGGRSTLGALVAALTSLPGVREKDIRISEDHIEHPGVVRLDLVVPDLDPAQQALAVQLIEETRPAGIRVIHGLRATELVGSPPASPPRHVADPVLGAQPVGLAPAGADNFYPVAVLARVFPATLDLTAAERSALADRARAAIRAFVDAVGVGQPLVYNALIQQLMGLAGVLDVDLELWAPAATAPTRRRNVMPASPGQRPALADADLDVRIGGTPLALDVQVRIKLIGAGAAGDATDARDAARLLIVAQLDAALALWPVDRPLDLAALRNAATNGATYEVEILGYKVDYVEAGVRILKKNPSVRLTGLERLWLRSLEPLEAPST